MEALTLNVRGLNAIATIYSTQNCNIDLDNILGVQAFNLQQALSIDPKLLDEDAHEHDRSIRSVAISQTGSVDSDKLNRWLYQLVQVKGADIFRMKGILDVDNEPRRFVCQGVHMTLDGRPGKPWQANEVRQNELVFIGRNLDENSLRDGFVSCFAKGFEYA